MMISRFFAIIILLALLCPVGIQSTASFAEPDETVVNTEITDTTQQNLQGEEQTVTTTEEASSVNTEEQDKSTFKQPISKKKIVKKFLLAMFCVVVSSFLIFFVLTLYNKVRSRIVTQVKTPEGETPLKTPENINEAVQIFLEKTQWK